MKKLPPVLRAILKEKSKHKYGAKRTTCLHKHDHDSQKEAMWCVKLHQEQREGKIQNLLLQVSYDLRVNGTVVCRHILDFDYERLTLVSPGRMGWVPEVVDVKGMKLPVWSLKHKMFCAIYPGVKYVIV